MNNNSAPSSTTPSYRSLWIPDVVFLFLLAAVSTVIFRFSNYDIELASLFYRQHPAPQWFMKDLPLWSFLYQQGPIIGISIAILALLLSVLSFFIRALEKFRLYALFLVAVLVVGPGLVVNVTFKHHWGRPRPRQTVQFGGHREFRPLFDRGVSGRGRSFPCGHSSAIYYLTAFYFIFRRRHRTLGWVLSGIAFVSGTLVGIARMTSGHHFASDVLWSFYLPHLSSLILYYAVFRIPAREDGHIQPFFYIKRFRIAYIVAVTVFLPVSVIIGLLSTPIYRDIQYRIKTKTIDRQVSLTVETPELDADIYFTNSTSSSSVSIYGYAQGFGWPGNKFDINLINVKNTAKTREDWKLAIFPHGFFPEKDVRIVMYIDATKCHALDFQVDRGTIRVIDTGRVSLPILHIRRGEANLSITNAPSEVSGMDLLYQHAR